MSVCFNVDYSILLLLVVFYRFVQYNPTSLERAYKHELLTEHDLGVNIDLINPDTYKIDLNGESDIVYRLLIISYYNLEVCLSSIIIFNLQHKCFMLDVIIIFSEPVNF